MKVRPGRSQGEHEVRLPGRDVHRHEAGTATSIAAQTPDGLQAAPSVQLLLYLQRTAGNRATRQWIERDTGQPRAAGATTATVQRSNGDTDAGQSTDTSADSALRPTLRFSVRVDREMGPRELLIEFAIQYPGNGITTREAAEKSIRQGRPRWLVHGKPVAVENGPSVTWVDVKKGYKLLTVYAASVTPASGEHVEQLHEDFWRLGDESEAEINRQTNELFWKTTGYKVGKKLDPKCNADDRLMAKDWLRLRAELVRGRQRYYEQPADLLSHLFQLVPPEARPFLFREGGKGSLEPKDFLTALRIASKIAGLTASERAEYLARVTGQADTWDAFEQSIDRFVGERIVRGEVAEIREDVKTRLFGTDALYAAYSDYIGQRDAPSTSDNDFARELAVAEAFENLRNEWVKHGFASFEEVEAFFGPRATAFREMFELEALVVAREMLDRYLHVLYVERKRIVDPAELETFWATVTAAGDDLEPVAGEYPLLRDEALRDDLGAALNKAGAQGIVLRHVTKREGEIAETRDNLEANPELIYGFDVLREQTLIAQGVEQGSVYHRIVMQKKAEIERKNLIKNIFFAVFAVAAGLLTGGGGAVAVLGAATAVTIGAYETFQEYRRYEVEHAAHGAGLLSDDPSFAWVIVAAVGAGLDMAAVGKALRTLRPALQGANGFEATGDVAALTRNYDDIVAKSAKSAPDVAKRLEDARASILKAALARAQEQRAWSDIFIAATRPNDILIATAESFGRLVYAVYSTLKVHGRNLQVFLKTREARMLLGELASNPAAHPGQLAQLREGFLSALAAQEQVLVHANKLRLRDFEIEHWMRRWAETPGVSVESLLKQMDTYAAPLARSPGSKYRYATELMTDADTRKLLQEYDLRIAGRGGVKSIKAVDTSAGERVVTIEGTVLPSIENRAINAPNFNKTSAEGGSLFTAKELGLKASDWEWAHLWGPGFGDEAAAGLMLAPREVNQLFQNRGVEGYIRELGKHARAAGGEVKVKASATSWGAPTPSGWKPPKGVQFLQRAEYRITLELPNQKPRVIEVTLNVAEPPKPKLTAKSVSPEEAADLNEFIEAYLRL